MLPYEPVLKTVCGRKPTEAEAFADKWGYRVGRDRLAAS